MGRIKFESKEAAYWALRETSGEYNESNDCSVIAVAAACDVSYEIAHATLKRLGRRNRSGTYIYTSQDAIKALGYEIEIIQPQWFIQQYPGNHKRAKNVTTHHPQRYNKVWKDGCNYILSSKTHMLAVIDGKNVDWSKGRSIRANRIWRITKVEN